MFDLDQSITVAALDIFLPGNQEMADAKFLMTNGAGPTLVNLPMVWVVVVVPTLVIKASQGRFGSI